MSTRVGVQRYPARRYIRTSTYGGAMVLLDYPALICHPAHPPSTIHPPTHPPSQPVHLQLDDVSRRALCGTGARPRRRFGKRHAAVSTRRAHRRNLNALGVSSRRSTPNKTDRTLLRRCTMPCSWGSTAVAKSNGQTSAASLPVVFPPQTAGAAAGKRPRRAPSTLTPTTVRISPALEALPNPLRRCRKQSTLQQANQQTDGTVLRKWYVLLDKNRANSIRCAWPYD